MTPIAFRAWLAAQGCTWAAGRNAGQIDYRRARALTGYSISHLRKMLNGRKPVGRRIEAITACQMSPIASPVIRR